ncbi:tRNA pseudouridine(55) synthase TruB [Paenibacillus sp.]|uniref:tRNA pseudouridine(55) synthase TruB n=1 Tax=Paenibacillus sp. TaxID=58172 RepID=UPI002D3E4B59|nr:tRNA pseudouridine(55) synthase TruB [Paenibacillus sp.]HZG57325.1 tRNA pseudouridine(55) synthase TruB [Paenibacillus sp.]
MTEWEGVFPLWKDAGMTSHDCVAKARKLFRMKRIGHTGTLDPDVSGVLPLCLGRATRIVEYVQELPKTYEAEMTIGYATDTEDASGAVVERVDAVEATEEQIRAAAGAFVGDIEQTPPMYSAVKVEGKRLYELARAGIEVSRKSRQVTIHAIEVTDIRRDGPYPKVRMTVTCSKGTYIRTLCADLGRALGYPAVMSALVRTASGPIRQESCVTFAEAERLMAEGKLASKLLSIGEALAFLPSGTVSEAAVLPALQGRKLYEKAVRLDDGVDLRDDALVRLYGGERLIGLYSKDAAAECFVPRKLFT